MLTQLAQAAGRSFPTPLQVRIALTVVLLLAYAWMRSREAEPPVPPGGAGSPATAEAVTRAAPDSSLDDAELTDLEELLGVGRPEDAGIVASEPAEPPGAGHPPPAKPSADPAQPKAPAPGPAATPERSRPASGAPGTPATAALGKLRQVSEKGYISTAGLYYGTGGAEGHRLLHVMEHIRDAPDKPVHGVFTGTKEEFLAAIDEAWQLAQQGGSRVQLEMDAGRKIYTVNLQRRIGYVGGEAGERRGQPPCQRMRLVVEGENRVITAFPVER